MKQILNESLQSLQVALKTPIGVKMHRLASKESIVIPATYVSDMIKNLQRRRLLKVTDYK